MPDQQSNQMPNAELSYQVHGASALSPELKEVLDFTERENQKHRDFFEMLYKYTAGALSIMVLVVGSLVAFVGWHTIADIRKQAQTATADEVKNIRLRATEVTGQETAKLRIELSEQLSRRINDEFKTPVIRSTVENAARNQTQNAIMPVIRSEVRSQVSLGVRAEQTVLKESIIGAANNAANNAIEQMKPEIKKSMQKQLADEANTAVASQLKIQITPRLEALANKENLNEVISLAQGADGDNFDFLYSLEKDATESADLRAVAANAIDSIIQSHNTIVYSPVRPEQPLSDGQIGYLLISDKAAERRVGVDSMSEDYLKTHIEIIYHLMSADRDLTVRHAAFIRFKQLTGAKFPILDMLAAEDWWIEHQKEWLHLQH